MKTTLFCLCVAPSIFILHRRNKIVTKKKIPFVVRSRELIIEHT